MGRVGEGLEHFGFSGARLRLRASASVPPFPHFVPRCIADFPVRTRLRLGGSAMTFRFGNLTLDTESRALSRDGRPIAISPKAFKLLQILLEERPRAIPKAELHRRLWPDTVVSEVNLPTLIAEIRQAIGDGAR